MFFGCFSSCGWLARSLFEKSSKETNASEESFENRPLPKSETSRQRVNEDSRRDSNEKPSEGPVLIPMKYISASAKEILTILESAAGLIPVPLLQEAIALSLKIIELCEEASAVEKKAKDLQDRVGHLMVVILAHVTSRSEEGDMEMVIRAARGMEKDVAELLNTLGTINKDLEEVKTQNRWMVTFYRDINMSTLDNCINRLSVALERFKLANDLRDSDVLQILQDRLTIMGNRIDGISRDMKNVAAAVYHIQDSIDDTRGTFKEVFLRIEHSAANLSSERAMRQPMPLKPEIFHGRDALVQEIVDLVVLEETSRVCILGPGGMGKTSVSLAIVESPAVQERFSRSGYVWVPCIGATSAALLLELLYVQLQIVGDKQATLEKIVSELSSSQDPRLLLFDNFETPWNAPGGQKEVEDILRQLGQIRHIAILLTMRGKYAPCSGSIKWQSKNIEPADEAACLRIFQEISPTSVDDHNVGRLLNALGRMPFAVALMANLAKEGQSTAEELLSAWSESGPDVISDNPEKSMNQSIKLSVDSPLIQHNNNAVLLLSILSLLPEGTTKKNLRLWAPTLKESMLPSAIAALNNAALLLENKQQSTDSPVLFVLPVVQSFMQQHDRIAAEVREQTRASCCKFILDHACRFNEPDFLTKSKILATEDSNIQTILFGSYTAVDMPASDRTLEAMIAFCWYRCDTKPSPDIAKRTLEVAESFGDQKYIGIAHWCLGRTYYFVHAKSLSYEHLQKAYEVFQASPDSQYPRFCGSCGIDLVDTATFVLKDEAETIRLAREVEEKCATLGDDTIHGKSLLFVGVALEQAAQSSDALEYYVRAKNVLESAGSTLDLIEVYQMMGRLLLSKNRIADAVDALEEGWKLAAPTSIPYLHAMASSDLAKALVSSNRDADAMPYLEIALTTTKFLGNQWQVSIALEYMGYVYLRRGDYQNALNAYEAATNTYMQKTTDKDSGRRCEENAARIMRKLVDDEVVGFLRPIWDPNKSLFEPSRTIMRTLCPPDSIR